MADLIRGRYRDILTDAAGISRLATDWRTNRMMDDAYRLIAALLRGESAFAGIRYWAFGTGLEGWDAAIPRPLPNQTRLTTEIGRIALGPDRIRYLDEAGQPSEVPTMRIQVRAEFVAADFVTTGSLSLREFALFGGDADASANSGLMINRVIHPRIDLRVGDTLNRTLDLTFNTASTGTLGSALGAFAQDLPVEAVQGVGATYATALHRAGLFTLSDLATMNPLRSIRDVPASRVRELRAKARAVANIALDPDLMALVAGRPAIEILASPPQALAEELASDARSEIADEIERAAAFQDALAPVQFGIDESLLQVSTLESLMDGRVDRSKPPIS